MAYELIIIGGGILFGLIGFIIGALLVHRAYKQSPSLNHYQRIIDILTLRKLRKKGVDTVSGKSLKTDEDHIEHYEDMRDKLTIRKKKEIVEMPSFSLSGIMSSLIGAFVAILIGVTLLPIISRQTSQAISQSPSMNASSWAGTVLEMVPAFFVIGMIGIVIAVVSGALRNSGMV